MPRRAATQAQPDMLSRECMHVPWLYCWPYGTLDCRRGRSRQRAAEAASRGGGAERKCYAELCVIHRQIYDYCIVLSTVVRMYVHKSQNAEC